MVQAQAPASQPPFSRPVRSNIVADRLELGFKLCARHVVQQGILAPEHKAELAGLGVTLVPDVADYIKANTGPLFVSGRIFAKVGTDSPLVYVSTAANATACRVIVSDTDDALRGRVAFVDNLRRTGVWTYDQRRSGTANGMMKDELLIKSGRMIAIMNGPNTVVNDGRGIQAFLTVALLPAF